MTFGWSYMFHLLVGPQARRHLIDGIVPDAPWWLAVRGATWRAPKGRVEATSFVNPRAVPQMADAEVMARVQRRPGVSYEALVPNVRGAQDALRASMDAIVVVVTAS